MGKPREEKLADIEEWLYSGAMSSVEAYRQSCIEAESLDGIAKPQPPKVMIEFLAKAHACILASVRSKAPVHTDYTTKSPAQKLLELKKLETELERQLQNQN